MIHFIFDLSRYTWAIPTGPLPTMTVLRLLYTRPPKVFISYRREDTGGEAGRLDEGLRVRWGARYVRRDITDIPPGADFNRVALEQIGNSEILLVLIGPRWLEGGNPERLADPADFVRQEIETALKKNVRVIPVLVRGAQMPRSEALPPSILPFARLNAVSLSDERWTYDMQVLASRLERRAWWWAGVIAALAVLALVAVYALRDPRTRLVTTTADTGDSASTVHQGKESPLTLDTGGTDSAGRSTGTSPSMPRTSGAAEGGRSGSLSVPGSPLDRRATTSPAPPPPPSPSAEPRSPPAPTVATGSVVETVTFRIGPERYQAYELTITDPGPCRLRGRVETISGGSRDIDVLVLTPDDYGKFPHRRTTPVFAARRTTEIALDVLLPGPGRYHFVVSNYFSGFTGKQVTIENVRWECAGG